MNNKTRGFSLLWVLIIVIVTSIISALTIGIIVYNNNKITSKVSYSDLSKDEELNEFLEVYASIVSEYYEDIDKKELLENAISAMMNYLGDDYTTYLNDQETNDLMDTLSGKYDGIGVAINNEDKRITKVYDDTPASLAGIKEGDIIVGFNDLDVTSVNASEIVKLIKSSTEEFTLTLKRGNDLIKIPLKSKTIINPSIDYYMLENTSIGYLAITTFSKTLPEQIKKALNDLESKGLTSLIIDVRDNTGGYLDAAESVANMFIAKNKILYSLNYKNTITNYKDTTDEERHYPIIVLTNGNTASASEILAAALKESYGAKIVGETTFGKGKVQQTMPLEDGSMVKYTSATWLTPNGTCIDSVGIIPDYPISNEVDSESNLIDNQLNKAISILSAN